MYRIGIDLGGTNIAAGLVNEEYKIIAKASVPTDADRGAEAIVDDIAALCKRICEENGIAISDVDAILPLTATEILPILLIHSSFLLYV